jgi:hypothetical protein
MEVTLAGLELNSVSSASFGARGSDGRFILRGGTYLSSLAKAQLPMHMGGANPDIPEDLDERTIQFMDMANAMSSRGFKGAADPAHDSEPRDINPELADAEHSSRPLAARLWPFYFMDSERRMSFSRSRRSNAGYFFQHFLLLSFVLQILPNEFKYLHFSSIIIIDFLLLISNPRDTVYYPNVHLFYIYFHETQMSISSVFDWFLISSCQHIYSSIFPQRSQVYFSALQLQLCYPFTTSQQIQCNIFSSLSVQHLLKPIGGYMLYQNIAVKFHATREEEVIKLYILTRLRVLQAGLFVVAMVLSPLKILQQQIIIASFPRFLFWMVVY